MGDLRGRRDSWHCGDGLCFLPECRAFSGVAAGWNAVSSYVEKAVEEKADGDPAGAV